MSVLTVTRRERSFGLFPRLSRISLFLAAAGLTLAAEFSAPGWVAAVPAAVFALLLLRAPADWLNRRSGQVAAALTTIALVLWLASGQETGAFLGGVLHFNNVIILLVALPLFRLVFTRSRLEGSVLSLLRGVSGPLRMVALLLSSWVTAFGLSFGTIGVLGASLQGRSQPAAAVPGTIMRGVVLSMLLGPTTGSVAVVMATFPGVSWMQALTLGLPLAAAGLALAAFQRGDMALACDGEAGPLPTVKVGAAAGGSPRLLCLFAGLAAGSTLTAHILLGVSILASITLAAIATAALWFSFVAPLGRGEALEVLDDHLDKVWRQLSPEIALFLACGLIASALEAPLYRDTIMEFAGVINRPDWIGIAAIVIGVPLLTVNGIHPMVPFSVLSGVVTAGGLGLTMPGMYTMWIVTFMLSMLVSPVSVLNLMTATSFRLSPWQLGIRTHALYALAFGTVAILFLRQFSSV
jgi:hypothetical protein